MATIVKFEKCEGCGDCVETCPCGAIELKESKAVIDGELCADCGAVSIPARPTPSRWSSQRSCRMGFSPSIVNHDGLKPILRSEC